MTRPGMQTAIYRAVVMGLNMLNWIDHDQPRCGRTDLA
jgi:hypothetical protein